MTKKEKKRLNMKKIKVEEGLTFYSDFKLLPKDFLAITLFGRIFSNMPYDELKEYLNTPKGKITINHERIHTLQAKEFYTRYLGFYIVYIYYYIKNLFHYYGNKYNAAYYNIPFEKEAYYNESDFNYPKSNWKEYKDKFKSTLRIY